MDAEITNTGTEAFYLPGPNIDIPAGETKTWPDVIIADLDGNTVLKAKVLAGDATVVVTPETADAAEAATGALSQDGLPKYALADLPTGYEGRRAFVTNGRKTGEGSGYGTGIPAYFSDSDWRRYYDDDVVTV